MTADILPLAKLPAPDSAEFTLPAAWTKADRTQFARLRVAAETCLPDPRCNPARLAEAAGLSERTLYRRLRALTGLTPAAFLRELRLLWAQQLLRNGAVATVGEVAFTVGFINANHFGRVYAERFGLPPGQDKAR